MTVSENFMLCDIKNLFKVEPKNKERKGTFNIEKLIATVREKKYRNGCNRHNSSKGHDYTESVYDLGNILNM